MQQQQEPEQKGKKSSKDRLIKITFAIVTIVILAAVFHFQRKQPFVLKDWSDNLDECLARAANENRQVLVLFINATPGKTEHRLAETVSHRKGRQAIQQGNFILAKAVVDSLQNSPVATKYNLKHLPTLMLLDKTGQELARREGYVPVTEFTGEFLKAR